MPPEPEKGKGGEAMTIDNIDIQISASCNTAADAISRLNSQFKSTSTILNQIGSSGGLKKLSRLGSMGSSFSQNLLTITSGLKGADAKINSIGSAFKKAAKPAQSLTGSLLKAYGTIKTLQVGFDALGNSITNSMDYIETLNYFDKAFEQVSEKANLSSFREMGYASAEAYAASFSERAKELTSKMTGFALTDRGVLETTGMPSLGLDPGQLMNYQAMFGQMASSMGAASETSLKLSRALTEIGADLASVKNMNFDKVWKDMASGIVGMSRTLDKYGVNIRNVNLQQKLTELGIHANIQALNQNDKALLRTIILLDSTRYAWGDLAETINAPASQLRLLRANFNSLARTIGNLFLPVVAAVLPYLNGLVIAVQRLFSWIGKLFGLDLRGFGGGSAGGGGISDLLDDTDTLEENFDHAADAAKKLKTITLGIDELNINSPDEGSGIGRGLGAGVGGGMLDKAFSDALEEYQRAWDEAFANMENRANQIADRIENFFKKLFRPLRKAWSTEGSYVMESWKYALQETGGLIADIGRDLMLVWQQAETVKIFEDIFHIVGAIGNTAGNLIKNFRDAWNECRMGKAILENIRDIFETIVSNIRHTADIAVEWSASLDFAPLLSQMEQWTESLIPVFDALSGTVAGFYENVLFPLGKWTLEKGLPDLLQVFTDFNNKVDWGALRADLLEFGRHLEPFAETVGEGLILFIDRLSGALSGFVSSDSFDSFLITVQNWMDRVDAADIANTITGLIAAFIGLKAAIAGFDALGGMVTVEATLSAAFSMLNTAVSEISAVISSIAGSVSEMFALWTGGAGTLGESFMAVFGTGGIIALSAAAAIVVLTDLWNTSEIFKDTVTDALEKIKISLTGAFEKAKNFINLLIESVRNLASSLYNFYEASGIKPLVELFASFAVSIGGSIISTALDAIGTAFSGLAGILAGGFDILSGVLDIITGLLTFDFSKIVEGFSGMGSGIWEALKGIVSLTLGAGIDIIGGLLSGLKDGAVLLWNWLSGIPEKFLGYFGDLPGKFLSIGSNIINGLWEGIKNAAGWLYERITEFCDGFIGGFKKALNINSPSKEAEEISGYWIQGLGIPFKDGQVEGIKEFVDSFINVFSSNINYETFYQIGSEALHGFSDAIYQNTQMVLDAVLAFTTSVATAMKTGLGIGAEADPSTSMFGGLLTNFTTTWELFAETWTLALEEWKLTNNELYFGQEVWNGNWMNLYNTYVKVWADFTKLWKKNFDNWWKVQIIPYFSVKQWNLFGTNMQNGLFQGFKGIVNSVGGILNSIIAVFDEAFTKLQNSMNDLISDYNKAARAMGTPTLSHVSYQKMGKIAIPQYEAGGFIPKKYSIAMVGENGIPELMGTVGGQPAVAGGAEITGIRDAVYSTSSEEMQLMREQNELLLELVNLLASGEIKATMDPRETLSGLKAQARREGFSFA